MQITIHENILKNPELANAVAQATSYLQEEVGPSSAVTSANWALCQDARQEPVVDLTISDFSGSVEGRFAPGELKNNARIQKSLHRLWGDLLQSRSRKQLEKVHQLLSNLNGE